LPILILPGLLLSLAGLKGKASAFNVCVWPERNAIGVPN